MACAAGFNVNQCPATVAAPVKCGCITEHGIRRWEIMLNHAAQLIDELPLALL